MPSKKYVKKGGGVKLRVRFSEKPITGWGGLVVMSKWYAKIGFKEVLEETFREFELTAVSLLARCSTFLKRF